MESLLKYSDYGIALSEAKILPPILFCGLPISLRSSLRIEVRPNGYCSMQCLLEGSKKGCHASLLAAERALAHSTRAVQKEVNLNVEACWPKPCVCFSYAPVDSVIRWEAGSQDRSITYCWLARP